MNFALFAFRFFFEVIDPVFFPAGAAGNAFRGAFGHVFRRIVCASDCRSVATCEIREHCAYAKLFEPACLEGPSGLADAPRPFVIRASSLDGQSYEPKQVFSIDVHIFDLHEPAVVYFVLAFAELARQGIGSERGRIRLIRVCALDAARQPRASIYETGRFVSSEVPEPLSLVLGALQVQESNFLTLRFATPTELKDEGVILSHAPFAAVFERARDRIATLSKLYGTGPLDIDFRGMAARAAEVTTVASNLRWQAHTRKSSRTHQAHPLSGFVGEVQYQGNTSEFVPFLKTAYWTGIGRQTVWGKGVVEIIQEHAKK